MKCKWGTVLTALLLMSGCNAKVDLVGVDPSPPGVTSPAEEPSAVEPADATPRGEQPTLEVANWEETQKLVAQNAGKVVILDLWASW